MPVTPTIPRGNIDDITTEEQAEYVLIDPRNKDILLRVGVLFPPLHVAPKFI